MEIATAYLAKHGRLDSCVWPQLPKSKTGTTLKIETGWDSEKHPTTNPLITPSETIIQYIKDEIGQIKQFDIDAPLPIWKRNRFINPDVKPMEAFIDQGTAAPDYHMNDMDRAHLGEMCLQKGNTLLAPHINTVEHDKNKVCAWYHAKEYFADKLGITHRQAACFSQALQRIGTDKKATMLILFGSANFAHETYKTERLGVENGKLIARPVIKARIKHATKSRKGLINSTKNYTLKSIGNYHKLSLDPIFDKLENENWKVAEADIFQDNQKRAFDPDGLNREEAMPHELLDHIESEQDSFSDAVIGFHPLQNRTDELKHGFINSIRTATRPVLNKIISEMFPQCDHIKNRTVKAIGHKCPICDKRAALAYYMGYSQVNQTWLYIKARQTELKKQ